MGLDNGACEMNKLNLPLNTPLIMTKDGWKMNYQEMTDEELDKLAGIEIMGYRWLDLKPIVNEDDDEDDGDILDNVSYTGLWDNEHGAVYGWRPCQASSTQAEMYLFPKIWAQGYMVRVDVEQWLKEVLIWKGGDTDNPSNLLAEVECPCDDYSKINRTKTIACLMAWEKLK